jgi:hypothetical protein
MLRRRMFWLVCWGISFAYIEASVVVYLRKIYYPAGFSFPAVLIEPHIAAVELVREIITLVFMWVVAELVYSSFQCRLAVFMFLFGIWDIFYYVFLKVLLNWPAGMADWDILFLVPLPWVGPVWAPIAVSAGMIWAGTVILTRNEQGLPLNLNAAFMFLEVAAGLIIITSFIIPGQAVIHQTVPQHFPWYLFMIGFGGGLGAFGWKLMREKKLSRY